MKFEMKKRFRFLEHTADAYVEAYGIRLEEAFENAALAMTDVMTEVERVEAKNEESFMVEAQDEYALLYSWLEELLLEFELKCSSIPVSRSLGLKKLLEDLGYEGKRGEKPMIQRSIRRRWG